MMMMEDRRGSIGGAQSARAEEDYIVSRNALGDAKCCRGARGKFDRPLYFEAN